MPKGWQVSPTMLGQERLDPTTPDDHALPVLTLVAPRLSGNKTRARITIAPASPLLLRTGACASAELCSPEASCSFDTSDADATAACELVRGSLEKR